MRATFWRSHGESIRQLRTSCGGVENHACEPHFLLASWRREVVSSLSSWERMQGPVGSSWFRLSHRGDKTRLTPSCLAVEFFIVDAEDGPPWKTQCRMRCDLESASS